MKTAARLLTALAVLAGVMAFTTASSSAETSKDEGYCEAMNTKPKVVQDEILPPPPPGPSSFFSEGTLKHKVKNNGDEQFDLRCKGQDMYLEPGTDKGEFAHYVCYMMGFYGDEYGSYFEYGFPGYLTSAKIKINDNGKFDIKCRYRTEGDIKPPPPCNLDLRDCEDQF